MTSGRYFEPDLALSHLTGVSARKMSICGQSRVNLESDAILGIDHMLNYLTPPFGQARERPVLPARARRALARDRPHRCVERLRHLHLGEVNSGEPTLDTRCPHARSLRIPPRPRTATRRTLESGFCVRLARGRQIVCSADSRGWARFPLSTGCGMRRSLGRAREAQAPRAGSADTTLPAKVTAAPSTR